MIFKNIISKKLALFVKITASILQILDHDISISEKRQFFAENWRNSQKIVIITLTPEPCEILDAKLFARH
jgi:hypothetical protein